MIKYHENLTQGSQEWLDARRGLITASEMHLLLTPTLKVAANDKSRAHICELLAQRISGYTEPAYIGDAMLRGEEEEILARAMYSEMIAPVKEVGFVTNDEWGFTLGYSPDGLVGDDGLIEAKSRCQKHQVKTIIDGCVPDEFMLQIQTGLLVTGRKWLDFISYSAGLPMFVVRAHPDAETQCAIIDAAEKAEQSIAEKTIQFKLASSEMIQTKRTIREEMFV